MLKRNNLVLVSGLAALCLGTTSLALAGHRMRITDPGAPSAGPYIVITSGAQGGEQIKDLISNVNSKHLRIISTLTENGSTYGFVCQPE
jgi:hypothetical protein